MLKITKTDNVCLITLCGAPAALTFVAEVFDLLARAGINVDIISQTPPTGHMSDLAFTVSDNDLTAVLNVVSGLREKHPALNSTVSSGNSKITISDETMRTSVGVASRVFQKLSAALPQVTLITTSEVDISLLISAGEADAALELLSK